MRLLSIFLLFSVITAITLAQRRTTAKPEISSDAPRQVSRGRGRTRFVASAELESLKETPLTASEPPSRRVVSRKRVPENIEHKLQPRPAERRAFTVVENAGNLHPRPPANEAVERRTFKTVHKQKPAPKPSYEVQEIVDEGINEPFKRLKKPRVLTESHFETTRRNSLHSIPAIVEAPRTTSVRTVKKLVHLEPSSSASPEAENSVEEFSDTTFKTLDTFTEDATSEKPEEEIFKTQPIVTTPKQLEAARPAIGSRRTSLRRHPEAVAEASTQAGRTRVRTRGTRIPETVFQPAVKPSRSSRRRVADSSTQLVEGTRKGPSVFSTELTQIEGRSRTGRRIEASVPEKITLDLPSRSFSSRRKSSSSTRRSVEEPRKRSNSNVQSPSSQIKSRRFQSREISFDETKLEVLPLFETEPKIVQTVARRTFRSRADGKATSEGKPRNKIKSADEALPRYESRRRTKSPFEEGFQTSATENDPKFVKADRVTVSVNVETRTQPPHRDNTNTRSSQIKESVMSEVNEITSRRTVLRRKKLGNIVTSKSSPKVLVGRLVPGSRGKKKSEVSLSEMGKKNDGSDDISEADNYPEAFKALLKAKNGNEESMASSSPYLEISTITNIVTSSSPTTSRGSTAFLDPVKDINDQENELIPKSSTALPRSTRHRFSQTATTSRPNRNPTTDGALTSSTTTSILNKYQGKHPSLPSRNYTNQKFGRNVAFRPREGSSYEKTKQTGSSSGRTFVKNVDAPILLSTKIPKYRTSSKALNRSKYRSEYPSRGAVLRSTTNAPRYIPTIPSAPYVPTVPTVTPSRTTVFETQETKDPDLGLEVISIDQPVKGIQSANLVNGDYVSPTTNNLSIIALPLVKDGTTEKPVSIIERIINSITAISTNSPPPVDSSTASTTESASAILKLAPKKSRQQDLTDATLTYTTDTATTEKPTTIIERILSSLNAIQATDHTNSAQVENDTVPTREAKLLSLDSIGTITTTKTNVASSSTSENNIHTENRFATQSTEAAISTQGTTTPTIAATTSSITTVPTSTTTDSPSSTLGSVSTPLSTFDKATFTTTETSTVTQSTSDASTVPVDMVTSDSSTTVGSDTNLMLPTLSDLFLNGRTLEAFNDIVDSDMTSSTVDTDTNYQTLQGIQYTRVLNIQDLIKSDNSNPVFRGKPTNIDKIGLTTAQPPSSTTVSAQDQSTTFTEVASTPTTPKLVESTTVQPDPVTLSNVILEDQSSSTTTTTVPPSTTLPTTTKVPTTIQTITRFPSTTPRLTSTPTNTILSQPSPKPTSMSSVPTSTFFPAFFTTLFPNLFTPEVATTRASAIRSTRAPGVVRISAVPSVSETIAVAASTTRATTLAPSTTWRTTTRTTTTEPTTVTTTRMPSTTTTTVPTTTRLRTTTVPTTLKMRVATTTSRRIETANNLNTVVFTTTNKPAKLKELSEEQKQNLRTLQKLEEEQAALLKQLSFLTNLNFGGANAGPKKTNNANKATTKAPSGNLADRVIELALERDRTAKTTTTKAPTSIQDKLEAIEVTRQPKKLTPSIDDVLKQYNLNGLDIATTPTSSAYGKSTDAILASILKEQGIAPPTPKSLGDQIKQAGIFQSTSKRPIHKSRTTTPSPPGPLMQGLNWLLNALAPTPQPPPTRRPLKPVKPKKPPVDQELLANSPTHVTPVVTAAPGKSSVKQPANALSQEDIQKLIKQLEGLQKDPSKGSLDLSQIKSIQNLINIDEGVVVMANGEHGNTFRTTTTRSTTERRQERKLVTRAPLLAVSNSVEDVDQDLIPTTSKPLRAPIGFRPVPGVDDGSSESLIRSNLITAAVNVTRAISGFLGTALQGAAHSFQSLLGSGSSLGSRVLGNVAAGSSAGPS